MKNFAQAEAFDLYSEEYEFKVGVSTDNSDVYSGFDQASWKIVG